MSLPLICVTLTGCTVDEMVKDAARATAVGADIVEVRLDKLWVIEQEKKPDEDIKSDNDENKKSVYINPNRIDYVEGLNEIESDVLLDELYEFSFQEKYQYSHNYEKGDLVIWDNRCTMHKANSDYDTSQLRVMHRVMLEGEKVF